MIFLMTKALRSSNLSSKMTITKTSSDVQSVLYMNILIIHEYQTDTNIYRNCKSD